MKIAVVGATGLVGGEMIKVLEESKINFDELLLAATEKSIGKEFKIKGKTYKVQSIGEVVQAKPDIALFSAGSSVSKEWAKKFTSIGCYVIDNSSAWRMDADVPLIVPEVNGDSISENTKLIANPNCSTIQMVAVLAPLHKAYKINRIVVSTYQSVTGTGVKAVRQLMQERAGDKVEMVYPHSIDLNCFPHGGDFLPNGYTTEEMKLVNETRKILADNTIKITATVVRIPVIGGHSEAVNVEFNSEYEINDITQLLKNMPGVIVQDEPQKNLYPMPVYAKGKNEVFVGRIRRDESREKCLNLWIVADNLRKGAATNAVQIADYIIENKLI